MAENKAARLLAVLARVNLDDIGTDAEGDIREALDALVLAAARSGAGRADGIPADPVSALDEPAADAPVPPDADTDGSDDPPAIGTTSDAGTAGAASVWLKDESSTHSIPGSPLSIGRAPALPNALDIGRALRPLRRFRPSRVHQRLDLSATVDHYTRTGLLVPQLAPAAEPWLEAVVAVDRGTSMAVWDETSLALTRMLWALSAFRRVHVWHIEHPPQGEPVLRDHHGRLLPMDPSDPRHTQPAHRLLLVVSDCATPAWRRSELWQTLHKWGRTAPVALINPLPKRLWQRTGLDLPRTVATASVPASPGGLLAYRRPRLFREDAPGTQPWQALPVLQMDAHQVLAWAHALMRTDPSGCEAVLVPASGRVPSRTRSPRASSAPPDVPATGPHITAAARAFTDNRQSPAVRLAIAASSLDAFTLAVLDVLRERIVPDASLADTAEFLTAGLLTATRHEGADMVYRFLADAATHLRGLLSRDQAWDAHFALTDHLRAHPQAPHGIVAALHSPTSQEMLPTGLRPVAQAAAATARLLGVELTESPSGLDALDRTGADVGDGDGALAVPDNPPEPAPDVGVATDDPRGGGAVMLRSYQRQMLDRLNTERDLHDRHRNLLIAPPGTGRTVTAAFDYEHLCRQHDQDLRLLFVAGSVEAVHQARETYESVLGSRWFGESLPGTGSLERGHHVFATWQSLDRVLETLAPDHFDVIVIDEFHTMGIRMLTNIMEHFAPRELLVLSVVPERTNGAAIHEEFFEGRIAAELRLPDALAMGLLTPLHYFGFANGADYQGLGLQQGEHGRSSLNEPPTADDARARLVIRALQDTVPDVRTMRAVGVCESTAQAETMTRYFRDAGFRAATLLAKDRLETRHGTLSSLRSGDLQAVFCVDALGGNARLPEVDTLLLLRPLSSAFHFLRQLSVGLGLFPGKSVLNVLDFIGYHRREVRLDHQLGVLTNLSSRQLLDHIEHDAPPLGSGCTITFDETAKRLVTAGLRAQIQGRATDLADGNLTGEELPSAEQQVPRTLAPTRAFHQAARAVRVRGGHGAAVIVAAGIMLTPRLVLTCAHTVDATGLRIVRTDGTEIPCRTVWKGTGSVDAALVVTEQNVLDSGEWERLLPSRLRWGRMPDGAPSPVLITGFGSSDEATELQGTARTVAVEQVLSIDVVQPASAAALKSSGALVTLDGFFVGMVTRRHLQRPLLRALPAELLLQDDGFRRMLTSHMTLPYELEDVGSEPSDGSREVAQAVCLAVEARRIRGLSGTASSRSERAAINAIRDSLTAILRRAGIDGVVSEEPLVADRRTDLLVTMDGPTAVRDMGRLLVDLSTAVAAQHDVTIYVGASVGEVADTRRGLSGAAVSQASRVVVNAFAGEQLRQAEYPVSFASSNTLYVLMAEMLDPALKDRFVPIEPIVGTDAEADRLYEGSIEDLGRALADASDKDALTPAGSDRSRPEIERRSFSDAEEKVSALRTEAAEQRPEDWAPIPNPYSPSMPVVDQSMFMGRDVLIRQLTHTLQRGGHVVLHGQRRVGKSSILFQLQRRLPTGLLTARFSLAELASDLTHAVIPYRIAVAFFNELDGLESEGFPDLGIPRPVFADFRDSSSPQAILEGYLREIIRRMRVNEVYREFRLVLLLDESTALYAAIQDGTLSGSYMESWRAITESALFGSVMVGDERMVKFLAEFPEAFHSTRQQRLAYLDEMSAERLIVDPIALGDGTSRYRGDSVARIRHLTGGSPYYIQMFCSLLVDHVNSRRQSLIGPADVDEVAALLVEGPNSLRSEAFDNLLHTADATVGGLPAEVVREVLSAGLTGGPGNLRLGGQMARQSPMGSRVIDALLEHEVIVQTASGDYRIVVGLFAEWLWRHR
ncbi:SAV_2336 N-terminal domain-related protein [Streptomyces sp. NPDC090036]|uniref:SAV_2336 N-terminal domain-related protein n=1 Tax=Streptomyces sp. NPDC090036 TaxID=3365926 RepID=UPI0038189933